MKSLFPRDFWVTPYPPPNQNHNKTHVGGLENNKIITNQADVVVNQNFTKTKLLLIMIIIHCISVRNTYYNLLI